jgi:hypothetical protein
MERLSWGNSIVPLQVRAFNESAIFIGIYEGIEIQNSRMPQVRAIQKYPEAGQRNRVGKYLRRIGNRATTRRSVATFSREVQSRS